MRIILVRHGQTKWNSEGRVQGRTDIPLNARGMAQAEAVGEWLSGRKIDAVYASPLMRAHDTAKAIADRARLKNHLITLTLREVRKA